MTWVYEIPLWLACVIFIGVPSLLSAAGLLVTHRFLPKDAEITHNDVAGPIMATIGTVLAVLLSFMVVVVWQEYDAAAQTADNEGSSLIDTYYAIGGFPAAQRDTIRSQIIRYIGVVVQEEWPGMRHGQESTHAHSIASTIVRGVQNFEPKTVRESNLQVDAIGHVHDFIDKRRDRLFNNQQAVPMLVWAMLFLVAVATVGSSYFFYVASLRTHLLMSVALGAVIGATFLLIAELDLPFRGPLQIPPHALEHALTVVTQPY